MTEESVHVVKRASPNEHENPDETHPQRGHFHGNAKPAQDDQQCDDACQPNSAQTANERLLNMGTVVVPALFSRQHSPNFRKRGLKIELFVHCQQPKQDRQ